MSYDYGRSKISKATGLTGVVSEHIAKRLKEQNIDPEAVDWEGAISDAKDFGDRFSAVKKHLADYYGIDVSTGYEKNYEKKMEIAGFEDLSGTKKGVKQLLNQYYKTNSNQEKEKIKEALLGENPMHYVLMTALYDGEQMPLAKKFLNEQVGTSVPLEQKPIIINVPEYKQQASNVQIKKTNNTVPVAPKKTVTKKDILKFLRKSSKNAFQPLMDLKPKQIDVVMPKIKKAAVKEAKSVYHLFGKSFRETFKPTRQDRAAALRKQVENLRLQNEPLRLQLEYMKLLREKEQLKQLQQLQHPRSSSIGIFGEIFGLRPPMQRQTYVERPGYYIETRPKLPKGYRWKKLPGGSKKKQKNKTEVKQKYNKPPMTGPPIPPPNPWFYYVY
jgi:hypothetical protein